MTRVHWIRLVAALLIVGLGVGGAMLGIWLRQRQVQPLPPVVTVTFLELVDGDCTVIQTPGDHSIIIDAGGSANDGEVPRDLRRLGIYQIDLLVLAAPTEQAQGGVADILHAGLPIRSVWIDGVNNPGEVQAQTTALLQAKNVPIQTVYENENKNVGDSSTTFKVVWPPRYGDRAKRDNLVCRVDYGAQSCLFLGPLAAETEQYVISGASDQLHADVLQVTDHGSGEGSALELLRRVQPEIAIISSTKQTQPTPTALDRLQAAGADIWRTDMQGTVTVTLSTTPNTPTVTGSRL